MRMVSVPLLREAEHQSTRENRRAWFDTEVLNPTCSFDLSISLQKASAEISCPFHGEFTPVACCEPLLEPYSSSDGSLLLILISQILCLLKQ
jgi:hypothetical protein